MLKSHIMSTMRFSGKTRRRVHRRGDWGLRDFKLQTSLCLPIFSGGNTKKLELPPKNEMQKGKLRRKWLRRLRTMQQKSRIRLVLLPESETQNLKAAMQSENLSLCVFQCVIGSDTCQRWLLNNAENHVFIDGGSSDGTGELDSNRLFGGSSYDRQLRKNRVTCGPCRGPQAALTSSSFYYGAAARTGEDPVHRDKCRSGDVRNDLDKTHHLPTKTLTPLPLMKR